MLVFSTCPSLWFNSPSLLPLCQSTIYMQRQCVAGRGWEVLSPEPVLLNVYGAPELMPRNEFRQPMQSGGPVRKPYSSSVPSPHRLFKNTSSVGNHILYLTRFTPNKIYSQTIQTKTQDGRGPQTDKHLFQSPFTGQFVQMMTFSFGVYTIVNQPSAHYGFMSGWGRFSGLNLAYLDEGILQNWFRRLIFSTTLFKIRHFEEENN